jgi:hypothetical protein
VVLDLTEKREIPAGQVVRRLGGWLAVRARRGFLQRCGP